MGWHPIQRQPPMPALSKETCQFTLFCQLGRNPELVSPGVHFPRRHSRPTGTTPHCQRHTLLYTLAAPPFPELGASCHLLEPHQVPPTAPVSVGKGSPHQLRGMENDPSQKEKRKGWPRRGGNRSSPVFLCVRPDFNLSLGHTAPWTRQELIDANLLLP